MTGMGGAVENKPRETLQSTVVTLLFGDETEADAERDEVVRALMEMDPSGERWGAVVRHTYDTIYNGAETGRYRWDQLAKTEKTHFGTIFEINAQRAFRFADGQKLDFEIAGIEVDAKWSQDDGKWMLPPEVIGHLALVATGSDASARFSLGVVRAKREYLSSGEGNRDKKLTLSRFGRTQVQWVWRNAPFPASVLLQIPPVEVDRIFGQRSGAARVDQLFRVAEGRAVHRSTVRTVAMQLDDQKRVRANGGSRTSLAPEGFLVLSGKYHAHLVAALGFPELTALQYLSVRVVPSEDPTHGVMIAGRRWRRWRPGDLVTTSAPTLPDRGVREK